MRVISYTAILFLLILSTACGSDNSNSINVRNLQILYSQDEALESVVRRKDWKPLAAPFKITLPYMKRRGFSHAWLKGEFYIKNDPSQYEGITLEKYYCTAAVYINNKHIGYSIIKRPIDVLLPSAYIIPGGILTRGKNEVHIRLGLWENFPGGVKASSLVIQSRADHDQTGFWNDILYKQTIFGILILNAALFIITFTRYIISGEKLFRFFALGSLINSFMFFYQFINYENIGLEYLWSVPFALVPIMFIFYLLFIQYMYRLYLSSQNKIAIPVLVVISAAILFSRMLPPAYDFLQVLLLFAGILFGYSYTVYILYRLHSIRPNRAILFFNIGIITAVLLLLVLQIILFRLGIDWFDMLITYIQPLLMVPYFIYDAVESKKRKLKMEQLYSTLKESKDALKPARLTITDSSEEKLARVMEFINKNYTSDISREGLAAAVDLNPNYLSSLFNAYTGKKINEYINHLRIKEAAKKLKDKEIKIIEIAFEVGFESLSTFIRAFKTELGVTPTEYRGNDSPAEDEVA